METFLKFIDRYETRLKRGQILHKDLIETYARLYVSMREHDLPTEHLHAVREYVRAVNDNLENLATILQEFTDLVWNRNKQ